MRFGRDHLPRWALALADAVAKLATRRPGDSQGEHDDASADIGRRTTTTTPSSPARCCPRAHGIRRLQSDDRQPVRAGRSLAPHVDLDAFADGVAVVSLRSTVVMDMYPPGSTRIVRCSSRQPVWLRPGDVMFLSRAARWEWSHGIAARVADPAEGETGPEGASWVRRGCRTSVTLRAMREDGHELRVPA